jgi:glycosyltransferase involved in cell wall biosynthesis
MRILFLSRWYPYPSDNGARIRVFNLLKHLSSRHTVDLLSFTSETLSAARLDGMRPYCRRVEAVPYRPFRPNGLKAVAGFFAARPRSVIDTYSAAMQASVERAARENAYDAVIASEIDMAPYALFAPDASRIFEEVELTTVYEQFIGQGHPLKRLRGGLTWWKLARYIMELLHNFEACTVVSEAEGERVREVVPGYAPIEIIPNGVDMAHYAPTRGLPEPDTLVYSGALTYQANFDAVDFFLREVFPLIRVERPNVKLLITGGLEGVRIDRLPMSPGVILTGYLDDIRPTLANSWVSVVPLRLGGGTRLKILEALALGTPVVATSKGVEGLNLTPGHDFLWGDAPADFAAAVLRLLKDSNLRTTLSRNGRRTVAAHYDWQTIGQKFNDFVETTVWLKALLGKTADLAALKG